MDILSQEELALLTPAKKTAYDAKLQAHLETSAQDVLDAIANSASNPVRAQVVGNCKMPIGEITLSPKKDMLAVVVTSAHPTTVGFLEQGRNLQGVFTKKLSSFDENRVPLGYNSAMLSNALNSGEKILMKVPLISTIKGHTYLSENGKETYVAGSSEKFNLDIEDGVEFISFGNWDFIIPQSIAQSAHRMIEKAMLHRMTNPVVKQANSEFAGLGYLNEE